MIEDEEEYLHFSTGVSIYKYQVYELDKPEIQELFEHLRWGNNILCPFCSHDKVYKTASRNKIFQYAYKCAGKACSKRFTVITNTVFHGSKVDLVELLCFYQILIRDTVSIYDYESIGVSHMTAFRFRKKIKAVTKDDDLFKAFHILLNTSY